jgi:(E)-4-hydroxy-3-methylbut-2-enyl-diphosphate synthase
MRIGTNHGSLSDRIMNRFGDTPRGMVESALEFARICHDLDYHDLIFSMKASNPKVMIQAYRLLVARLDELGWCYPLHLGVTEAGGGEDGRIKSAIGIGALLDDGLGDTIRVSLTEEPEAEVPVAFQLLAPYNAAAGRALAARFPPASHLPDLRDPFTYTRRVATERPAIELGGANPTRVVLDADVRTVNANGEEVPPPDLVRMSFAQASGLLLGGPTAMLVDLATVEQARLAPFAAAIYAPSDPGVDREIAAVAAERGAAVLLETSSDHFDAAAAELLARLDRCRPVDAALVLALRLPDLHSTIRGYRLLSARLAERQLEYPLHLVAPPADDLETARLATAVALGSLLCDGIGDSVEVPGSLPAEQRLELTYNVLQGAGARVTRTEYVACPSCGRTLFDLQDTTARIRSRTGHLKGVKIAIMGCVVNGPGEMADADFGYVGGAPERVNLYVGKELVERNVPQEQADARLIELIKSRGRWSDPPGSR